MTIGIPTRDTRKPSGRPTLAKRVIFSIVLVVGAFTTIELVLMLIGVQTTIPFEDPYVGFQKSLPLFERDGRRPGSAEYRTVANKRGLFNVQSFPAAKADRAFRIFCLGGSTTYGRPYDDRTSFAGWLRRFLAAADPDRDWQVINCGGISYASYRVAALMEELVRYEPDLFIIYTGHNEFLERRTYHGLITEHPVMTRMNLMLGHSRLYSLMRSVRQVRIGQGQPDDREGFRLSGEVRALLDSSVGLDRYQRDDGLRQQILDHFRFNIGRMVAIARAAGAELLLVQPAANRRDFSPFKSQHRADLAPKPREIWQRWFDEGKAAYAENDFGTAQTAFEQALRIDDRHAELQYELGRTHFALGRYDKADAYFQRAIDEDVCPLRILSDMHGILTEVAEKHGVPLIDFRTRLERESRRQHGHEVLGGDDFLDHVHPTIRANRVLGRMLVDYLIANRIAHPCATWNDVYAEAMVAEYEHSLDRRDHAIAQRNLAKVLRWAGKEAEANRLAALAATILSDDPETVLQLAASLQYEGKLDQAAETYARALQLDPALREAYTSLGLIFARQDRFDEALQALRVAVKLGPDIALTHANLAQTLVQRGDHAGAIASYQRALSIDPAYPQARIQLAQALMNTGRLDDALRECQEALRRTPRSASANTLLGDVLGRFGRHAEAIVYYRQALAIEPANALAHNNLANALGDLKRFDEAVAHYEQAIKHRPDFAEACYNLGITWFQQDDLARAKQAFDRAIAVQPDNLIFYERFGQLYALRGRVDIAMDMYRRGLEVTRDHVPLLTQLAWLLAATSREDLRDGEQAVRLARRACELTGNQSPNCLNTLAVALGATGDFDAAREAAGRAYELASRAGNQALAKQAEFLRERFNAGLPFREANP